MSVSTTGTVTGQSATYNTLTTSFAWWDGAMQDVVTNSGSSGSASSTFGYNRLGQLMTVAITGTNARTVRFVNDTGGQVLRRSEGYAGSAPDERWYRFAGREMAMVGNNGSDDMGYEASIADRRVASPTTPGLFRNGQTYGHAYSDFGQGIDPVNSFRQGSSAGRYTVQGGESLASIAANLYGEANLWYKIAEANGLTAQSGLIAGQQLILPAGVMRNTHNAGTFSPYDPASIIGDTSPQPLNPQPKQTNKKGCGVLGAIIMIAIAVAVTALTQGSAAGIAAKLLGVGAKSFGAVVLGGAAAGAAGSIASQTFGLATGIQDKFDWKGVGLSAVSGAVSGGLGKLGDIAKASTALDKALTSAGNFMSKGGFLSGAARGAVSSAITQGVSVATGLQDKFSWTGVAVGAAVGGVTAAAHKGLAGLGIGMANNAAGGAAMTLGNYVNHGLSGMAGAIAGGVTRSLIEGSNFGDNVLAAIPDVIGATLGNMLVDKIQYEQAASNYVKMGMAVVGELGNAPPEMLEGTGLTGSDFRDALSDKESRSMLKKGFRAQFHDMINGPSVSIPNSPSFSDIGYQPSAAWDNVSSWGPSWQGVKQLWGKVVNVGKDLINWVGSRKMPGSNQTIAQKGAQISRQIERFATAQSRATWSSYSNIASTSEQIVVNGYNYVSGYLTTTADGIARTLTNGKYDAGQVIDMGTTFVQNQWNIQVNSWNASNQKYQVTTRALGALQGVGGLVEMVGGGALGAAGVAGEIPTLGASTVAVVGGGALFVMGADNVQAGFRTMWNGETTNTAGAKVISSVTGMSTSKAELAYAGVQLATGVGAPQALRQSATAASRELVPVATKSLGDWGEARLANHLGGLGVKPASAFKTPFGARFADNMLNGIAYESKAGLNVKLTSSIEKQITKDAWLIRNGRIKGAEWHFWRGADSKLIQALQNAGIKPVVH